jgi:tRNA nucleotidyltransferase (CCA-adding enzyme)
MSGELQPDRVWKELSRALMEPHPHMFFDTLLEADALHVIFPEVYRLKTALESRRWHPEGDSYEHVQLVLQQAASMDMPLDVRLACLCHDFGKGITPRDELPRHHGHDTKGVPIVEAFCDRLRVPTAMKRSAMFATRYHMIGHQLDKLNPKTYVKMYTAMNVSGVPRNAEVLYWTMCCDTRGRLGHENADISHLKKLLDAFEAIKSVRFQDVFPDGETNVNKITSGMLHARINAVKNVIKQ